MSNTPILHRKTSDHKQNLSFDIIFCVLLARVRSDVVVKSVTLSPPEDPGRFLYHNDILLVDTSSREYTVNRRQSSVTGLLGGESVLEKQVHKLYC